MFVESSETLDYQMAFTDSHLWKLLDRHANTIRLFVLLPEQSPGSYSKDSIPESWGWLWERGWLWKSQRTCREPKVCGSYSRRKHWKTQKLVTATAAGGEIMGTAARVLRQVTLKTLNHLSMRGTPQPQWIIENWNSICRLLILKIFSLKSGQIPMWIMTGVQVRWTVFSARVIAVILCAMQIMLRSLWLMDLTLTASRAVEELKRTKEKGDLGYSRRLWDSEYDESGKE